MTIRKFAGIVDKEIFTIFNLDSEFQGIDGIAGERIIAGYLSEPKFVEIPTDSEVTLDWTWDGTSFVPPSQ